MSDRLGCFLTLQRLYRSRVFVGGVLYVVGLVAYLLYSGSPVQVRLFDAASWLVIAGGAGSIWFAARMTCMSRARALVTFMVVESVVYSLALEMLIPPKDGFDAMMATIHIAAWLCFSTVAVIAFIGSITLVGKLIGGFAVRAAESTACTQP